MSQNLRPPDAPRLEIPRTPSDYAAVPCGKCHLCCQNTAVVLLECDDASSYEYEMRAGMRMLKVKQDGDCFYLGLCGCAIHDRAPYMCRIFDCREQHRMYSKEQREKLLRQGMLSRDVLRSGAILIHQEGKNAG